MIDLLHERNKNLKILQLGDRNAKKLKNADGYIFDRPLKQVKRVLEKSILHIDCEGGLVHLATALGTKCVVLFGPTPMFFYEYSKNINISSNTCGWCMGVLEDWFVKCCRGYEIPPCMNNLCAETIVNSITEYLVDK